MGDWRNNEKRLKACRERAAVLVGQMTLEEKVFQLMHKAPAIKRLNIKSYNYWNEALHGVARAGVATVFPQAIGLAATFDEDLLEEVADAIATEGRAKYNMQQKFDDTDIFKGLSFWSPNVNIFRDPRWGRGQETFGEDPYLTTRLGIRFIEGLQGHEETYMKAAACAKHFAVHSGPEDERHRFNAKVSQQDLRETYLPAFEACVKEAKVEAVMGAYNAVNGEPCCAHDQLLVQILRGEWGFEGHVTSDCWALKDFHEGHRVTETPVESVALAMNKGCDLNCGNLNIFLLEAVKKGMVREESLDRAVWRLLTARMKLGILDDEEDNTYSKITYRENDSAAMTELNLKAARKSIVLLKNEDHILPVNIDTVKNIGVIGPNANNRKALIGNYEGTASRYTTILEGIQDYVGERARVFYSEGCHLYKDRMSQLAFCSDRISEVKAVCEESDLVIACLGLDPGLEGEDGDEGNEFASGDKPGLELPGIQEEVLKVIAASGKPVILVLLSGSALAVTWADEHVKGILQGWYPGAMGGKAIAEAIFGDFSPEGKLPVTFYRTTEELPAFEEYSMKGRTYRYMEGTPLYPFGYGLSYTEFELTDVSLSRACMTQGEDIVCRAVIKNKGGRKGAETVQIYVKADREDTPNAQLKKLCKVELAPSEEKEVTMVLPFKAFGLYDREGNFKVEDGTYRLFIGLSQPDRRSAELTGLNSHEFTVRVIS